MKLSGQLLTGSLSQCLLNKLTGLTAFAASEAFGFHTGLAVRGDDDFDGFIQAAPPMFTVSLMEPSSSDCSVMVCPFLRASSLAFSTAYDWRKRSR